MPHSKLRWGILGTANIARKNWLAIRNSGNGIITAVASRDAKRAQNFITQCQSEAPFEATPRALGSYDALIAAKDIDAVYIPLPTNLRKHWVISAAEAGKHVVVEKPCAVSVPDLREMIEACRKHRVQFMDGVMFMHSRRLDRMREALEDGSSIGQIRRITSAFSFLGSGDFFRDNIRGHSSLEPHGCLGDLGWYCIRFALWAMRWQLPRAVAGRLLSSHTPQDGSPTVPSEFSGELLFDHGVSAGFYCSFLTVNEQWANVCGTSGQIHLQDFVLPFYGEELSFEVQKRDFNVRGCEFRMEPDVRRILVPEHSNSHPTAQETMLFRHFADQVRSGSINETWPQIAYQTQQVMEACLQSAQADSARIEILGGKSC